MPRALLRRGIMDIIKVLTLNIVCLSANTDMKQNFADAERWISRFNGEAAQTFLRSLMTCSKDNVLYFKDRRRKKDEITNAVHGSMVKTDVRNIPCTEQTMRMMYALFGDDGVFSRDGFHRFGMVSAQGSAYVTVTKTFENRTVVLEKLQESKTANIGSGVFSVLTQMLFLPEDITRIEDWLIARIKHGDQENEPCAPKVVINYRCCEETAEPTLAPKFGSIDMGIN